MDADLSKLPTGSAGWLALAKYAVSLGDLAELDYLELKGGLPFATSRDRKRSAVVVSRAVLGMANRMPDVALRHLGGAGVILVGIDRGSVVGVEQVDGAVLRDAIQPYLGIDGPRWDHQFIVHPEGLVLAVIVDPPRWGDSIHTCRKEFSDDGTKLVVRDGEVFIRIPGKTRAANSHEMSQLEKRRLRSPDADAKVCVSYNGLFDRISKKNLRELFADEVDNSASRLLDELPEPRPVGLYGANFDSLIGASVGWSSDQRSVDAFRSEVEEWRRDCRVVIDSVADEFLRYTLPRGEFVIVNGSDRYLETVRVRVQFPSHVRVLLSSDTDYCDHGDYFQSSQLFPKRPVRYGQYHGYDIGNLGLPTQRPYPQPTTAPSLAVEKNSNGYLVSWIVGDLPPRAQIPSSNEFAVFVDEDLDHHRVNISAEADHECLETELSAGWEVTARGIDHVFGNTLAVECRQDPGVVLLWSRQSE